MRTVGLLLVIAACGSETPLLAGVPHPNNVAIAGGAAAVAAALTLADPHAADRKPEQRQEQNKRPVEVTDEVPASVFDHLDSAATATGSGTEVPRPHAKPAAASSAPPPPTTAAKQVVIPSAHDAIDPGHGDARASP
jgi:hypothetical protein